MVHFAGSRGWEYAPSSPPKMALPQPPDSIADGVSGGERQGLCLCVTLSI